MAKITLFAQVIRLIPREIIQRLVKKHGTDKHAKGFNSWSHLVTMMRLLHKGEWLCCFLPINTELCRGKVISTWGGKNSSEESNETSEEMNDAHVENVPFLKKVHSWGGVTEMVHGLFLLFL